MSHFSLFRRTQIPQLDIWPKSGKKENRCISLAAGTYFTFLALFLAPYVYSCVYQYISYPLRQPTIGHFESRRLLFQARRRFFASSPDERMKNCLPSSFSILLKICFAFFLILSHFLDSFFLPFAPYTEFRLVSYFWRRRKSPFKFFFPCFLPTTLFYAAAMLLSTSLCLREMQTFHL